MTEINKISGYSMDIERAEKEKLRAVFPQCFVEGKLDIDKLLNLCGEYIDNDFEKYKFEWKGKSDCYKIAGKRSTGTLRPCKDESVDFENTKNMYIEGDNLEVLKLLQNSYYGKIKMIILIRHTIPVAILFMKMILQIQWQNIKKLLNKQQNQTPKQWGDSIQLGLI